MAEGSDATNTEDRPGLKWSQKIADANQGIEVTADEDRAAFARHQEVPNMMDTINSQLQDQSPKKEAAPTLSPWKPASPLKSRSEMGSRLANSKKDK